MALVNLFRLVTIPLPYKWYLDVDRAGLFLLQTMPAGMYMTAYLLLVFYWAAVYHRALRLYSRNFQRNTLLLFIAIVTVAVFAAAAVAVYLQQHNATYGQVTRFSGVYIGAISLAMVLFAMMYGLRVCIRLREYSTVSEHGRSSMRRVGWIAVVCVLAFLIRAPAIFLIKNVLCQHNRVSPETYQVLFCGYLLAVDIIPAILVLYLIRTPPTLRQRAQWRAARQREKDLMHRRRTSTTGTPAISSVFRHGSPSTNSSLANGNSSQDNNGSHALAFNEIDPLYITMGSVFGADEPDAESPRAPLAPGLIRLSDDDADENLRHSNEPMGTPIPHASGSESYPSTTSTTHLIDDTSRYSTIESVDSSIHHPDDEDSGFAGVLTTPNAGSASGTRSTPKFVL
jgi:THH1/TOM1/TOM3 domain